MIVHLVTIATMLTLLLSLAPQGTTQIPSAMLHAHSALLALLVRSLTWPQYFVQTMTPQMVFMDTLLMRVPHRATQFLALVHQVNISIRIQAQLQKFVQKATHVIIVLPRLNFVHEATIQMPVQQHVLFVRQAGSAQVPIKA